MKTLLSLIYVLIRLDIVVALLCILFVMASRQQQAQMTAQLQKSPYQPETINWEIKAKLADEQQHLLTNQQQYEQRIKKLEEQLKVYRNRQIQSPEVKVAQPSISAPNRTTVALQPAPVSSVSAPLKPSPSPALVSPRRTTASKPSPSSVDSPKVILLNPHPSPSASQLPTHPKGLNNTFSNKYRVNPPKVDHQVMERETIALTKPQESNPENAAPSQPENKGLSKNTNNTQAASDRSESIAYANDISTGLAMAHDKGQIKYRTKMYRRVQTAILVLRRGASKEEAVRQSGVPKNVLDQLIEWGAIRPGKLNNSADNSDVSQDN